jgi:soluble lytic murein transglycosylase-like protein
VGGAFLLVLALAAAGWLLVRPEPATTPAGARWEPPAGTTPPADAPDITTAPPTTTAPEPTKTKKPKSKPKRKPASGGLPPAPPKRTPGCIAERKGSKASRAKVRDALTTAARRQYWAGVTLPPELNGELPTITVPRNLMKAVAWQESGWQSNIIACDGGIGTMQVMPDTAVFVNNRFGTSYDPHTLGGNAAIGAAYLEWLTMYFGLFYFDSFDLSTTAEVGPDGAELRLRDVVISAYNVGPAALEDDQGTPEGDDDTLSIPNRTYVRNVTALISECECLTF